MRELSILIDILEKSVEKNGEKPLTNLWLLNIMKMVQKQIESEDEQDFMYGYSESDWGNN